MIFTPRQFVKFQIDSVYQHFEVLKEKLEWTKNEYKKINDAFDIVTDDDSKMNNP